MDDQSNRGSAIVQPPNASARVRLRAGPERLSWIGMASCYHELNVPGDHFCKYNRKKAAAASQHSGRDVGDGTTGPQRRRTPMRATDRARLPMKRVETPADTRDRAAAWCSPCRDCKRTHATAECRGQKTGLESYPTDG